MPTVEFAEHLRRHVDCPPQTGAAGSLRAALEQALAAAPGLREYVLDEQGALRPHVALFVNGERLVERQLARDMKDDDQVYVVQALSGG